MSNEHQLEQAYLEGWNDAKSADRGETAADEWLLSETYAAVHAAVETELPSVKVKDADQIESVAKAIALNRMKFGLPASITETEDFALAFEKTWAGTSPTDERQRTAYRKDASVALAVFSPDAESRCEELVKVLEPFANASRIELVGIDGRRVYCTKADLYNARAARAALAAYRKASDDLEEEEPKFQPAVIVNEEAGISELVIADVPTVTGGEMIVRPLFDMTTREIIGFQWDMGDDLKELPGGVGE